MFQQQWWPALVVGDVSLVTFNSEKKEPVSFIVTVTEVLVLSITAALSLLSLFPWSYIIDAV